MQTERKNTRRNLSKMNQLPESPTLASFTFSLNTDLEFCRISGNEGWSLFETKLQISWISLHRTICTSASTPNWSFTILKAKSFVDIEIMMNGSTTVSPNFPTNTLLRNAKIASRQQLHLILQRQQIQRASFPLTTIALSSHPNLSFGA